MSKEQKILQLRVRVRSDEKEEGTAYLDFDFVTKNLSVLLLNVQQLGWNLIPGAEEIHATYLDDDGDRCALTDGTAIDALRFAQPGDEDNTLILEVQVQGRAEVATGNSFAIKAGSSGSATTACSSCSQLKLRFTQTQKDLAQAQDALATTRAAMQSEIDAAVRRLQMAERTAVELQDAKADAKRNADEVSRLSALCDTLRAEVASARRQGAPETDNAGVLSASVTECSPLVLGIEAYEDASKRGDAGQDFKELAKSFGASEVFRFGRMQLVAASSDGSRKVDSVPACAKVNVVNSGAVQWPETTVVTIVKGDSFGVPLLQLGPKSPGETEEVIMDLLVPPRPENTTSCSVWAVTNAATGTPLGPLLVLEAEWRTQ